MKIVEMITARGHPRIMAKHPTTLMITKDKGVGPRGDCIVGVSADKGAADLSDSLKRAIRSGRTVRITLEAGGVNEIIHGSGHPALTLEHPTDLVIRKSGFTCGRTLAIGADKAASDLSEPFRTRLQNSGAEIKVLIEVPGYRSSSGSI
jgi:hypothetical protein